MPRVLSMTPKPDEPPEDFAARVGEQVSQFFKPPSSSADTTDEATGPVPAADETSSGSDAPTDVSAGDEEPAPSS